MRVVVRGEQMDVEPGLREGVAWRVRFKLGRFARSLASVEITLSTPAPDAPVSCRVALKAGAAGRLAVHDEDRDARAAVDRAVERALRLLQRELARRSESVPYARPNVARGDEPEEMP